MEDVIEYCPYCPHGFTRADLEREFCEKIKENEILNLDIFMEEKINGHG